MSCTLHLLLRTHLSPGITLALIFYASGPVSLPLLNQFELFAYDAGLRLTLPGGVDPRIVIVKIDEASLLREGQWPWPRQRLAQLVDLSGAGPPTLDVVMLKGISVYVEREGQRVELQQADEGTTVAGFDSHPALSITEAMAMKSAAMPAPGKIWGEKKVKAALQSVTR